MMWRKQVGVTLLELLVALFIFALSAGALLKIVGEHGRHVAQLEARYFAQVAAHNHLARLHLEKQWPSLGKRGESLELAGHPFYRVELVETTDNELIRRVSSRVHESDEDGPILGELQAFMGPEP